MMSCNNLTLNIGVSIFSILVFRYRVGFRSHFGEIIMQILVNSEKTFDIGFLIIQYFDRYSIDF